jgi:hypothetical protein
MQRILIIGLMLAASFTAFAQVTNTAILDTTDLAIKGKVTISGYIDTYYGYDFSNPANSERPYSVSMNRHNEFTVNLAFADIKYSANNFRARFVPAFGTYMNANYASEPGTLKNILEAYIGVKLFKNKEIWLDAGVLGSPYTNESAISKDHLVYTRSFAPEYVPYYLSGLKLTLPLSPKVSGYLYFVNGWQVIQDNNHGKSLGTQIEWRPTDKLLINWNTYLGDERSAQNPNYRTRLFTDIYAIYNHKGKFSGTACFYIGSQERVLPNTESRVSHNWWTANIIGRYRFTPKVSLSGRFEYFNDPNQVLITPITQERSFSTYSASLGLNIDLLENIMLRFESRSFFARQRVYLDNLGRNSDQSQMLIANLTAFF